MAGSEREREGILGRKLRAEVVFSIRKERMDITEEAQSRGGILKTRVEAIRCYMFLAYPCKFIFTLVYHTSS